MAASLTIAALRPATASRWRTYSAGLGRGQRLQVGTFRPDPLRQGRGKAPCFPRPASRSSGWPTSTTAIGLRSSSWKFVSEADLLQRRPARDQVRLVHHQQRRCAAGLSRAEQPRVDLVSGSLEWT